MTEYFENNFVSYRKEIDASRLASAIDEALKLLSDRKKKNGTRYKKDHKGSPFYVAGYAAFASHDYTSASLYFDAAVGEDLRNPKGKLDTPAIRFMQLKALPEEDVLARDIVIELERLMKILLKDYNRRQGSQRLSIKKLRSSFLKNTIECGAAHERSLVTCLLSFVAEWPYRAKQIKLLETGSREPFFLHLLRGGVLFESLLKQAPNTPSTLNTLGKALNHHKSTLGISSIDTSSSNFNSILGTLTSHMTIEDAINTCGKSRNTVGHNVVWNSNDLTNEKYNILVKNISAACLHAISKLY